MTPTLPLFLAASLVGSLIGTPLIGAMSTTPDLPGGEHPNRRLPVLTKVANAAKVPPVADVVMHTATPVPDGYWTPERRAHALPISLLSLVDHVGSLTAGLVRVPMSPGRTPSSRADSRHTDSRRTQAGHAASGRTASSMPARRGTRQRAKAPAVTSGTRWAGDGAVRVTTGRVFLTMKGVDFVCSASAVRSANRDVVVTAGHCVKDGTGSWAENWTFVPGYDGGREPYGTYSARQLFVAGPWSRRGDDSFDVGMVALNTRGDRHLTDVVGAQRIGFNTGRGQPVHGFGFPADPPYNGEHLLYCAGPVHGDPYNQTKDQGVRCDLTAGASGGPWLTGFDSATGMGTVISVSSFKYSNDRGTMYGPYFGDAVKRLFETAERA